jgi:hypothetical protein
MSFLFIKDNQVRCTDEGMTLKEVQKIYNNDKTGKARYYFNNVIMGIFYIYKPRGIYWNKPIKERIDIVNMDHLREDTWDNIIKKDGVQELITKFVDLSYTINDTLIDVCKTDAAELTNELKSVPSRIETEVEIGTEVICDDDIVRLVKIKKKIFIPNFENKDKLYKYILTLSKTIEEITERLKIEEDDRLLEERTRRLYDGKEQLRNVV